MSASFAIEAGSVFNPFAPGVLAGFHCPHVSG
jgi:type VI protein secretion system component VasK